MEQNGQFILFDTKEEFKEWLFSSEINRDIWVIQQHHTYIPSYDTFNGNNYFSLMKSMKEYHTIEAGMSDIAQNFTIFPDGKIMLCRNLEKMPAGIKGQNSGAICIENIGNFDVEIMAEEQKESILYFTALLSMKFNIAIDCNHVIYHHWFNLETGERSSVNTKTCPGIKFFGGNTVESAQNNFYPLINQKIYEINNPAPPPILIEDWERESLQWLLNSKYIDPNTHTEKEIVTFAGLGVILMKVNNIQITDSFRKDWKTNSIKYLKSSGLITGNHSPDETIDFSTLGVILSRYFNETISNWKDGVNYLLNRKLIMSNHDLTENCSLAILGVILKRMKDQK